MSERKFTPIKELELNPDYCNCDYACQLMHEKFPNSKSVRSWQPVIKDAHEGGMIKSIRFAKAIALLREDVEKFAAGYNPKKKDVKVLRTHGYSSWSNEDKELFWNDMMEQLIRKGFFDMIEASNHKSLQPLIELWMPDKETK